VNIKNKLFEGAAIESIMNKAYLLTGGNLGKREKNLARARTLIDHSCGAVTDASSLYETAAWGKTDQPGFLNQALAIQTALPPQELLSRLLEIEKEIGRVREEKYGPRIIDIDILLFDGHIVHDPQLIVPHPQLQNRRFALTPLAEIAPGLIHPVFKKTIRELLDLCPDPLEVKKTMSQD
jgi:2-amino-4-hydroxy-6-hydroxymethyldihydropteridine diphosphokinase